MAALARDELPQIPTKTIPEFVRHCQKNGVNVHAVKIGVMNLIPIQKHLKKEKVQGMLKNGTTVPLMVSGDNHIMDGHHRWAAEAIKDRNAIVPCIKFDCAIPELVELGHSFDKSKVRGVNECV
jgi:hypothetical protein